MKLRLFRGISLSPSSVDEEIQDIKNNGINNTKKSSWQIPIKDIKKDLESFFNKQNLSLEDTSPSKWIGRKDNGHRELINAEITICFADKVGAEYYAKRHNITKEKSIPVLIEIEEDIENIFIDGRDFLYTCFKQIDFADKKKSERQTEALSKIFGIEILKYINKINEYSKINKCAVCDLIIQDETIIKSHLDNKILLQGRCGTIFHSAFSVKVPILPSKVLNVNMLDSKEFIYNPSYTLDNFFERN